MFAKQNIYKTTGYKGKQFNKRLALNSGCIYCINARRRVTTYKSDNCFFQHLEKAPPNWELKDSKRQKTNKAFAVAIIAVIQLFIKLLNLTFLAARNTTYKDEVITQKLGIFNRMFSGFKRH